MPRRVVPVVGVADEGGSLEALYRRHRADLCRYLRRTFGAGPPEPEDLAQAAFARFAALEDPARIRNPKAYLILIARNLAIDARRRMAGDAAASTSLAVLGAGRQEQSAEDILASREDVARLAAAVSRLKPKQRVAFLLHRVDGLSFVEIARRMGVSESGARLLVDTALAFCVAEMRK